MKVEPVPVIIGVFALGLAVLVGARAVVTRESRSYSPAEASGTACFTVSDLRQFPSASGSYIRLTGKVRNSCPDPMGVELKWTVYQQDGSVGFSTDFWPASTTNIAPYTEYPFETINSAPQSWDRFTVEPINAHPW